MDITLNQYVLQEKLLKKFNYFNLKPASTSYDPSMNLKKNNGEPIFQLKYSQLFGSLLYLANRTRPDIAYAVGRLSGYDHKHSKEHYVAFSNT